VGGQTSPEAIADVQPDAAADTSSTDAGLDASPSGPGSPLRALAVSTGTVHTCALLENHRIKCWGYNDLGELGLGDTRNRGASASDMGDSLPFVDIGTGRTAVAVSAGNYHTCAILDDGSVKCWGLARYTGLGTNGSDGIVGDAPGEIGDRLPALVFSPGRKAKLLSSGRSSSCAILDDGSAWCWGDVPTKVALGFHADAVQLFPWHYGAIALLADHTLSPSLPVNTLSPSFRPTNVVSVAGAESSGCAVLGDGTATCDGMTLSPGGVPLTGLLGLGLRNTSTMPCGLYAEGAVRCWGSCALGPIIDSFWCGPAQADLSNSVVLEQPAVAITTGADVHSCALLADGGIKCWTLAGGCTAMNGVQNCDIPTQDAQDPNLGSSVEIVTVNGARRYGAWRTIDLGKQP
jgi:hypothetical protein